MYNTGRNVQAVQSCVAPWFAAGGPQRGWPRSQEEVGVCSGKVTLLHVIVIGHATASFTPPNHNIKLAKVALPQDVLREMPGGTYWKSDGIMDDHMKLSGKMRALDYLLRKYLKKRNRVLVFSYSTASLDIIQNHIKVCETCGSDTTCLELLIRLC